MLQKLKRLWLQSPLFRLIVISVVWALLWLWLAIDSGVIAQSPAVYSGQIDPELTAFYVNDGRVRVSWTQEPGTELTCVILHRLSERPIVLSCGGYAKGRYTSVFPDYIYSRDILVRIQARDSITLYYSSPNTSNSKPSFYVADQSPVLFPSYIPVVYGH